MLATHAQTKWRETDTLCVFLLVSFHESIKTTPFRLNSGRDPRTPLSWGLNVRSRVPAVEEFITNLQQSLQKAKLSLEARNRQQRFADMRRREVDFKLEMKSYLLQKREVEATRDT
jgi:hypothetical protein